MTDTFVDGKVQRIQAMLYAKALNAHLKTISPKAACGENRTGRLAVEGWGNT